MGTARKHERADWLNREDVLAFGREAVNAATKPAEGRRVHVAHLEPANSDGRTVDVFVECWPARFYSIEVAERVEDARVWPAVTMEFGSGAGSWLVAELARGFASNGVAVAVHS